MSKIAVSAAAATITILSFSFVAQAEVTFRIGDVTGEAGQIVSVPVTIDSSIEIDTWTMGIELDAPATITGTSLGTDAQSLNDGAGPGFLNIGSVGTQGVTFQAIVDLTGRQALQPGTDIEVFLIDVMIPSDAAIDDVYDLDFSGLLGAPPVPVTYTSDFNTLPPEATLSGSVTVVPAPATAALLATGGLAAARRRR